MFWKVQATPTAVARARSGAGPTLVECKTYRWEGRVVGEQAFIGAEAYRKQSEIEQWKGKCPILRFEKFMVTDAKVPQSELDRIAAETGVEVEAAVKVARASAFPDPAEGSNELLSWARSGGGALLHRKDVWRR